MTSYCLCWSTICLSISEWKDLALIIATYVALPSTVFAVFKTVAEIRKLREEKARERSSRIHAQQLEALRKLYEQLDQVQRYAQLMTKSAIFVGENVEGYPALLQSAFDRAVSEFVSARLLLPLNLVRQIEAFFLKVSESQIHLGVGLRTESDGIQRAAYWKEAATISHQEMPSLLASIEGSARAIIGSENCPKSEPAPDERGV
ncbi:MAG: hypothetical protein V4623_02820 [Pseudomonadota bacterium]